MQALKHCFFAINESKDTAIFLACRPPKNFLCWLKSIAYIIQNPPLKNSIAQNPPTLLPPSPREIFLHSPGPKPAMPRHVIPQKRNPGPRAKASNPEKNVLAKRHSAKINQNFTSQIYKINRVCKILYEITTAVELLHEKGIIHRISNLRTSLFRMYIWG